VQCGAVRCSALQCVAVCCSVLQCGDPDCSLAPPACTHAYIGCQKVLYTLLHELYGVATISRPLKFVGLFCKRALYKRLYSAKETYDLKGSTYRSHPTRIISHPAHTAPAQKCVACQEDPVLQCVSVLQCVAVCCSVLQCVAVDLLLPIPLGSPNAMCCSVLQCVAVCW